MCLNRLTAFFIKNSNSKILSYSIHFSGISYKERLRPNKTRLLREIDEFEDLDEDNTSVCYCEICSDHNVVDFSDPDCNSYHDNQWAQHYSTPYNMTLADFIQPDLLEMILLESEFEFLQMEIHENFEIGDYEFVDVELE